MVPGPVVRTLRLRDFRCYAATELGLAQGLTVLHGANGAGKTNVLEGLFFGLTSRSCRTSNERECVRFGASAARVEVGVEDPDGDHVLAVGFSPGEAKRLTADGAPVERLLDVAARPLVSVFLPIGSTSSRARRRCAAATSTRWSPRCGRRARPPAAPTGPRWRSATRCSAGCARAGSGARPSARGTRSSPATGSPCATTARPRPTASSPRSRSWPASWGSRATRSCANRPRTKAEDAAGFAAELAERVDADLERGFTTHGPHRDDLVLSRDGRELRAYGSQGEQRLALLALLLAEREALADARGAVPLLLLDDVMSELDADRRELLASRVRARGQTVITTTDLAHVPGAEEADVTRIAVLGGGVLEVAEAPAERAA